VADNGDRPQLRRALTASAAFLVIVTILLAAADTAAPPTPVTAAQQASSVTPPSPFAVGCRYTRLATGSRHAARFHHAATKLEARFLHGLPRDHARHLDVG
jgi:hypothetical protein